MAEATVDHVWDLMERVRFCMLSTWSGTRIRSRPMGAFVARNEGAIYFFTDIRAHKDEEIAAFPQVCLGFADTGGQKYVSVLGRAEVLADLHKIRELWSIPVEIWWKSPEDPNIRLIKVTPLDAEYWDSPGNAISSIKVAFALATGAHVHYGEHKKVSF
jgi:general stress protein 26